MGSTKKDDSITLDVRVVPRASCSEIVGFHDGVLKVRLTSPPVDNAANVELVKLLSKTFRVSKSQIQIVNGQTSRSKKTPIPAISWSGLASV